MCGNNNTKEGIVAFPWQQWLRERVTMLHFTRTSFLVIMLTSRLAWSRLEAIPLMFYSGDHKLDLLFSEVTKYIFIAVYTKMEELVSSIVLQEYAQITYKL